MVPEIYRPRRASCRIGETIALTGRGQRIQQRGLADVRMPMIA